MLTEHQAQPFFPQQALGLIPLDARPVCYQLPIQFAAFAGISLICPEKELFGALKTPVDDSLLLDWIGRFLSGKDKKPLAGSSRAMITALDTLAYGGLIPSRLGSEPLEKISEKLARFFEIASECQADVYGFSSIQRIPSYDNAQEEPDYWAQHGKTLYAYSESAHREPNSLGRLFPPDKLPPDILADFLTRRERNFQNNLNYLDSLSAPNSPLAYLAYCQDDTGQFGLNVQEAATIQQEIKQRRLSQQAHVQTGADELAVTFLAKITSHWAKDAGLPPLRIYLDYSSKPSASTIAKFDGLPIETVVRLAVGTCGGLIVEDTSQADLAFLIHTPPNHTAQGDHCEAPWSQFNAEQLLATQTGVAHLITASQSLGIPFTIADVAYANGGDPLLANALLQQTAPDWHAMFYGYAGWNTPGNSIGTALSMALLRHWATINGSFNLDVFKQALFTRLADDWLYQSTVRKQIRWQYPPNHPLPIAEATALLNHSLANGLAQLINWLKLPPVEVICDFPCGRSFEVGIMMRS